MGKRTDRLDLVLMALGCIGERLDAIEERLDAQVVTVNVGPSLGGMSREDAERMAKAASAALRPVTVDEALAAAGITAGPPERGAVIRRNDDPALTSMGYGSAVADVYGCRRYRMAQGWCNAHGAVVRLEYPLTVVHTTAHWEDDE